MKIGIVAHLLTLLLLLLGDTIWADTVVAVGAAVMVGVHHLTAVEGGVEVVVGVAL